MIFFVRRSANIFGGVDWFVIYIIPNIVRGVVVNVVYIVAGELGFFSGERSGFSGPGEDGKQGQEGCEFHFNFKL